MGEIVSQVLALLCNTFIAFSRSKRNVYIANFLFNVFALLTGFFQGDYGLCLSYTIILYRSAIMLYKDKIKSQCKHFSLTFIVAHIVLGIISWENIWSVIPIIAPIIAGSVMWYSDDLQLYRLSNILNNTLWGIHNFQSGSYILVLVRLYNVTINGVAYCSNRRGKKGRDL